MPVFAAIDIGTISTRLLIARVEAGKLTPLQQALIITRLGEGVSRTHNLSPAAVERTVAVLQEYRRLADAHGAERIVAVATSAVRDAENGDEFCHRALETAGITVRVIAGEKEAALSFAGAWRGLDAPADSLAVVDVGGGSTELIGGTGAGIRHLVSVDAGAVRMTEGYLHADPVDSTEYAAMTRRVQELLAPVTQTVNRAGFATLAGVGGTATTIAAVSQALFPYDPAKTHGYVLTRQELERIIADLAGKTIAERRQVPGLQPERADLIVAGAAIIRAVMAAGGWDRLTVSEADILHGLIWNEMENGA